jgi:hypothetical protein
MWVNVKSNFFNPEIYMREISSEKAEDESVNIDDTIESETFSVRRFQVKELILDYENKHCLPYLKIKFRSRSLGDQLFRL